GASLHTGGATLAAASTPQPLTVLYPAYSPNLDGVASLLQVASPTPINATISNISAVPHVVVPPMRQATVPVPATPAAPEVSYHDLSAQGGQPTIVVVPAGYALVNGVPNTPTNVLYTAQRLDGQSWTSLPNGSEFTGNANVETDDLPTQAGFTYTYRICARYGFASSGVACSGPSQVTTPAD